MNLKYISAILVLAIGLITTVPASAAYVKIGDKQYDVSETQAAEIALNAAKIAEANKTSTPAIPTIDEISKYAEIGHIVGASLAGTAKEMGVAVNDFANTPVGFLTTALIVYKIIGRDIIHYVFGSIWFLVSLPTWFYIWRHAVMWEATEERTDDKGKKVKLDRYRTNNGQEQFTYLIVLAVIVLIGTLTIFT